jgi:predicted DNA-binding transcriptional regulator AlpA
MPKRILREPEVCERLGLAKTAVREKYTNTGRLHWLALGEHTKGVLEEELDALIEEIARENRAPLAQPASLKDANLRPRKHQKKKVA